MSSTPFVLSASPRSGNTLEAARMFCTGYADESGIPLAPAELRHFDVLPCVACGVCDKAGQPCPLEKKDDSLRLFRHFLEAPLLALASPIYFYHLPALLKSLIDRCQLYYNAALRKEDWINALPRRKAYIMLVAAREKGDNLFKGSLLSLEQALKPFNIVLEEPVLLRGIDTPSELALHPDYPAMLTDYGRMAARQS